MKAHVSGLEGIHYVLKSRISISKSEENNHAFTNSISKYVNHQIYLYLTEVTSTNSVHPVLLIADDNQGLGELHSINKSTYHITNQ